MTLAAGDLTTPQRVVTWLGANISLPSPILTQLVSSMSAMIRSQLNRGQLYSRTFTQVFDGLGTMQIVLPSYPVTAILSLQMGATVVPPAPLPTPAGNYTEGYTGGGWGYRFPPWSGNPPGDNAVLDLIGGYFCLGAQNIKITYQAGYLVPLEAGTVPASSPYTITVVQPYGIWCRDNGVAYASTGVALTPVAANPTVGQYIPPVDSSPGIYTFSAADEGAALLLSYSFIPADLEEATIQMVAERYSYRSRVGEISKSLGGQETMRFLRGGSKSGLPPEVMGLIMPYVNVVPPPIGSPV